MTPEEILKMPGSEATKYVNEIQRRILAEHHGSKDATQAHLAEIQKLIPLAEIFSKKVKLSKVKVEPWQMVSMSGLDFVPDRQSIAFHREMDRLKRKHLGMGVAA